MSAASCLVLAFLLLTTTVRSSEATSPAGKAAAAALRSGSARCHTLADVDACYDAIRWNPGNPALLVALADALVRAKRPADALRNYRRAAELAPNIRGIAAKISAAEAAATRAPPPNGDLAKRYSNAAPEAQSH